MKTLFFSVVLTTFGLMEISAQSLSQCNSRHQGQILVNGWDIFRTDFSLTSFQLATQIRRWTPITDVDEDGFEYTSFSHNDGSQIYFDKNWNNPSHYALYRATLASASSGNVNGVKVGDTVASMLNVFPSACLIDGHGGEKYWAVIKDDRFVSFDYDRYSLVITSIGIHFFE